MRSRDGPGTGGVRRGDLARRLDLGRPLAARLRRVPRFARLRPLCRPGLRLLRLSLWVLRALVVGLLVLRPGVLLLR